MKRLKYLLSAGIGALLLTIGMMALMVSAADTKVLEISNAREFKEFAQTVNNGNSYSGWTVKLTADITLDGTINNFVGINGFRGTFDGCGFSVSGIKRIETGHNIGLFDSVYEATIKNVTLKNCTFSGRYDIGGIAGVASYSTITNCYVENTVQLTATYDSFAYDYGIGGIVGCIDGGRIRNCVNKSSITSSKVPAGGICGTEEYYYHSCIIANCANLGTVTATYGGGIIGYENSSSTLQNCYSVGTSAYGIAYKAEGNVFNCYCSTEGSDTNFYSMTGIQAENKAYAKSYMSSSAFLTLLNSNVGDNSAWFDWELRAGETYPMPVKSIDINQCVATLNTATFTYDGTVKRPTVLSLKLGTKILTEGKDYSVSFDYENADEASTTEGVSAGQARVLIIGNKQYDGVKTVYYTIQPKNASSLSVTLSSTSYTFDYNSHTPYSISVFDGTKQLVKDTDYTLAVSNNVNAGNAIVTITGKGNYTGTKKVTYTIMQRSLSEDRVTLSRTAYTYNKKKQAPTVTVSDYIDYSTGTKTLVLNKDYTVSYGDTVNAGTVKVTIKGIGNYTGTITKTYTIKKHSNKLTISKTAYTVKTKTKAQTITLSVKATGGSVKYASSNKKIKVTKKGVVTIPKNFVGAATITVKAGNKNYKTVSKKITIKVVPLTCQIKVSAKKTQMSVKWSANSKVNGYQIRYSTQSNMKNSKVVKLTKNSTKSTTIKGLSRKTTYYVQLRTYKIVGKKAYYSAWSTKKKVTTK